MKDETQNIESSLILRQVSEQLEELRALKSGGVEPLLSARMIAELFSCSSSAVLKGAKTGAFPVPTHKIFPGSKGMRWSRQCIQDFIDSKRILALQEEDDRPAPEFHGIRRTVRERFANRRPKASHEA